MDADCLSGRMATQRAEAVRLARTPPWAAAVLRRPVAFAVMFLVVVFAIQQVLGRALGGASDDSAYASEARELVGEGLAAVLVAAIVVALGWWRAVGFTGFRSWRAVWLAWFPALLVVVLFVLSALQAPLTNDVGWLSLSLPHMFFVGFFEETLTRGLVLFLLLAAWKSRPNGVVEAVLVSSALFGVAHFLNLFSGASLSTTVVQVGYAAGFGVGFAGLLLRTNTLWLGVILHALTDADSEAWFGPGGTGAASADGPASLAPLLFFGLPLLIYGLILVRKRKN